MNSVFLPILSLLVREVASLDTAKARTLILAKSLASCATQIFPLNITVGLDFFINMSDDFTGVEEGLRSGAKNH